MKKLYQDVKENFALNVEQLESLKPIIRFISKEQTEAVVELIDEIESFTIDIDGKLVGNKEPYQSGWSGDYIKKEEILSKLKANNKQS